MKTAGGILALIMALCIMLNTACSTNTLLSSSTTSFEKSASTPSPPSNTSKPLEPFSDVRGIHETVKLKSGEYITEDIYTYWFNQNTVFEGNEEIAAAVVESGKSPGLNVSGLHDQGITGEGVTVAIIDQPLLTDHPEYTGKIKSYHTIGLTEKDNPSSMHGPAVVSLLSGNTIGTSPDAEIYYVACKFWERNAPELAAEALDWLIDQNRTLPEKEKIRAVSISADLGNTENYDNPEAWDAAVQRAQDDDILVLDCRQDYDTCVFWPGYFNPNNRDDITTSMIGNPRGSFGEPPANALGTPVGYRTTAEVFRKGEFSYAYDAEGGHSWAIPYATGILALGWQINPALTGQDLIGFARQTAYINADGYSFLNPTVFIEAVRATL